MRRHRGLVATLAGGFLAAGFLQIPAKAQRSRVPDRDGGEARPAVERTAVERPAVERPAVERASAAREIVVPTAAKPAGLVAIDPARASGGKPEPSGRPSGGDGPRDSGRGDGSRYDGGGSSGRQDDDRRDGRRDNDRRDGRDDHRHDGTSGIVVNPIVVGVVWSEDTIYLDDLRHEQRVGVSDEPVEIRDGELGEPREPDPPRRMTGSLAALGAQYTFRPWYAVSEFVMAGYPVPYPDPMAATYDKRALANNADLPPAALEALQAGLPLVPFAPGTFGGVTFQIGPADAAVYVDGVLAGLAEDFTPVTAPLPLMVGAHRIELRARGFRVEAFEVIVTLGQVTPLSGLLAPQ